jgi:Tol biopolymer transport system component
LNDTAKPTIKWDDWSDLKKSFTTNWSEVDSPGSAMNSIYALTEKAKRNKISMESYINLFKEYVRKAGIVTDEAEPNNAAVSLFCQGLPFKVLDKAMNQNPTSLTGWYDMVQ